MRPLRLTVEGFTAFRTEQVLDMEALDLFAIVGPTGAGKSSLLDAMTFALYGQVSRVDGSQTSTRELVSQGLPWLKVMLEFQVGPERYRITRRMPAGQTGATKVLLERYVDGEPAQFGVGADHVRETNQTIEGLVGLDYDGFTRSVLLPQGKFADLLTGKADQRRSLLTDLLALKLFERMGERARRIAQDAERDAARDRTFLTEHLDHATPEAVREAKRVLKRAEGRERDLAKARDRIDALAGRWSVLTLEAQLTARLATQADRLSGTARSAEADLRVLAERAATAEAEMGALAKAEASARAEVEQAAAVLAAAERDLGGRDALVGALRTAERLPDAASALERGSLELAGLREGAHVLQEALATAEAAAGAAKEGLKRSEGSFEEARARQEAARHADLIAGVTSGARIGDPCPVCGIPLTSIPHRPGAPALAAATAAAVAAEQARDGARGVLEAAGREADRARRDTEERTRTIDTLAQRIDRDRATLEDLRTEIAAGLGDTPSADPVQELQMRIDALDRAAERSRSSQSEAVTAARAVGDGGKAFADVRADAGRLAGRLDLDLAGLGPDPPIGEDAPRAPTLPPIPPADDVGGLIAHAGAAAATIDVFAAKMREAGDRRAIAADELLGEATGAVEGLIPTAAGFEDIQRAIGEAALDAREDRARAGAALTKLTEEFTQRAELEEKVRTLTGRHRIFQALASELRANRIIDFLQGEALRILSVAGSEHLEALSGGRYRLAYEDDEFAVIDAENGDEHRSVRTLSGGETFLASLALALALAGQVRALAVSERAPLESLFLDEGFGALDPETLETVAQAIEQLGGDGRLVGIVTHVKELADRAPVRVHVRRAASGHGSELLQEA